VDFRPSALQRELAAATRELLDELCLPAVVRLAWDKPAGPGTERVWRGLAGLGLPGALAPESTGGLGLALTDVLPALVETGRAAVPGPVVETALVAAPLLAAVGGHDGLLAEIAAGDASVTAGQATEPLPWPNASHALLLDPGAGTAVLLERSALRTEPLDAVDRSRPLASVRPPPGAALVASGEAVAAAVLRGAVGTAAQLLGLARRQLDMTVEYVATRHQFGVPVGSFQAVKHHLADALLALRFAEPAVARAGLSLDRSAETATRDVAMAKALASDAAELVSRTAIQCHGAIGYTDEYDLHLYAKRTWALAAAWGTADAHRERYGDELRLPSTAHHGRRSS
jgi:alkylation response protein AidB-like acyl-CoA dehydrogenase